MLDKLQRAKTILFGKSIKLTFIARLLITCYIIKFKKRIEIAVRKYTSFLVKINLYHIMMVFNYLFSLEHNL